MPMQQPAQEGPKAVKIAVAEYHRTQQPAFATPYDGYDELVRQLAALRATIDNSEKAQMTAAASELAATSLRFLVDCCGTGL